MYTGAALCIRGREHPAASLARRLLSPLSLTLRRHGRNSLIYM
jgi:hypothetical protein